jgi:DNA-directed RNA polymerase subunit RPC12/RpoP
MKTYQVELKRVSYVNLTVEADSLQAAEDAAWLELQTGDFDDSYADWTLESIDEEQTDIVECSHCGEKTHIGGLIGEHTNNCPKCGEQVLFEVAV